MKTMKDLVEQIVETSKIANIDLEGWPRISLPSIMSTVVDAKARLEVLKVEYYELVSKATIGIFVFGSDGSDEVFATIAAAEGGTMTIHADALYQRMADLITPVIPDSKEFNINAFSKLAQGLAEVGRDLELKAMDMPKFVPLKVTNRAALVEHVRNTVRDALGDDLNRLYVSKEIQRKAFEMKFKGSALPVVIIGLGSADEATKLEATVAKFGAKVVTEPGNVTKQEVLDTFQTIKDRLKQKKPEAK